MKNLTNLFRDIAGRTKPLDEDAFYFETGKVDEELWDVTIFQGSEPYFRVRATTPEETLLLEERAQLVTDVMNAAPEMSELAAKSSENRDIAQEIMDTSARFLLALDSARAIGSKTSYTSDANQRALIAVSRAEDELRALILGSDGKAA